MPHVMDNGIITGNIEKKYDLKSLFAKLLMNNFLRCLRELIELSELVVLGEWKV
jgi:hypothetical protein